VTAALAATPLALAPAVAAEDPPPATLPARPLTDSIERVVQRLEEERKEACRKAAEAGVPCFPVSTEVTKPEVLVRDPRRDLGPASKPSPHRPPTLDEMKDFRPGPAGEVVPLLKLDPGCVGKSVLKRLKGKNDTYYLYRIRDAHGERVALYDRRLEASTFQGALEFLGRFDGECEALAAYRREDRK
jgi:hypothetical protein